MAQNREYSLSESEEIKSHHLMMRTRDSESQDIFTIYVEGPSDEVFYKRWLKKSGLDKKLSILVFDVKKAKNISLEGNGNCGRIIGGAEKYSYDDRKLFIADRDLKEESEVQKFAHLEALFFTDFPAIESYALIESVFTEVNYKRFDGDCKNMEDYYIYITYLIRFLYLTKRQFLGEKGIYGNFRSVVIEAIKTHISECNSHSEKYNSIMESIRKNAPEEVGLSGILDDSLMPSDVREQAYGHDIAPIVCRFISGQYPGFNISNRYIELALTNCYIDLGFYEKDNLFKLLQEYIEARMNV